MAHPYQPVLLGDLHGLLRGQGPDLLVLHPQDRARHRHLIDGVRLTREQLQGGRQGSEPTLLVALPRDGAHRGAADHLVVRVGRQRLLDRRLVGARHTQLGLDPVRLRLGVGQVELGLLQHDACGLHPGRRLLQLLVGSDELGAGVLQVLTQLRGPLLALLPFLGRPLLVPLDLLHPLPDVVQGSGGEGGGGQSDHPDEGEGEGA